MTETGGEPSAEAALEAALAPLGTLDDIPVAEHVAVFEGVLSGLETALTSMDEPAT